MQTEKIERRIETPAAQTSSLAFGGPDLNQNFYYVGGRRVMLFP